MDLNLEKLDLDMDLNLKKLKLELDLNLTTEGPLHPNGRNFSNNGLIFNPLTLLELSQSPLAFLSLVLTISTLLLITMCYSLYICFDYFDMN